MKLAPVIIGANYGDEGKGLMTDFFTRQAVTDDVIVVRFNGGAQAGHTVVTTDGERHVFSHFSSGTLVTSKNVTTYLSRFFSVHPMIYRRERETLITGGITPKVMIHPDAPVTTPFDVMINQLLEQARGRDNRHGSCGVGFGETFVRQQSPEFTFTVADIFNSSPHRLRKLLLNIRDVYMPRRLAELALSKHKHQLDDGIINAFIDDCVHMMATVTVGLPRTSASFVFEGAQGLALGMKNHVDFPHLTPSYTGLTNVVQLAPLLGVTALMPVYVTRAYLTRHGAGPLPGEVESLFGGIPEKTNVHNEYQGSFRYAQLNTAALRRRISADVNDAVQTIPVLPRLAVTCVDHVVGACPLTTLDGFRVVQPVNVASVIAREVGLPHVYQSTGPTANAITEQIIL